MKIKRIPFLTLLCVLFLSDISAVPPLLETIQRYAVPATHAEKFAALPVQSASGRIAPVNTFSSEVLRKLYKSDTVGSLNSDQFIISLLVMPDAWMRFPLIVVSNEELIAHYQLSSPQCAYIELFDEAGNYKLQDKLEEAWHRLPAERTRFDKDLFKLDEQINILHQLLNHQLLNLFPKEGDANHTWYASGDDLSPFSGRDSLFVSKIMYWYIEEVQASLQSADWSMPDEIIGMISTYQQAKSNIPGVTVQRIQAEIKYNKLQVFNQCKKGYLITGGLLLVLSFASMFRRRKWMKATILLLGATILTLFAFHTYGMGMRWYIAGYAPWSNSYETMVYVSWATVLAGFLFARKSTITFALATLFGGIILFVSGLNWMNPQITPLVPVLKSPWLMFHVAVIVAAYGFFGIGCLIGLTNQLFIIFTKPGNKDMIHTRIRELSIVNEMSLLAGLALMTIGTFLGAVWANESWGRYWGWDPKETWALITMIVYSITLHLRLVRKWNNVWLFNVMSVISFASVLMTFFGVNYFLSGMHAYGQNDNMGSVFAYLCVTGVVMLMLTFISRAKYKKVFAMPA